MVNRVFIGVFFSWAIRSKNLTERLHGENRGKEKQKKERNIREP